NIRKGEFSRAKVRGKRAIDLGSGMGLGGLAFALIGADVVLTDIASGAHAEASGRVAVAELDWSQPSHFTGGGEGGRGVIAGPYDYILAADCIYHEHLVRHLYRALLALSDCRSTILVANERRSESVQAAFMELFSPSFTFKKAQGYQHPAIELTILKRRRAPGKDASLANLEELERAEAAAAAAAAAAKQEPEAQAAGQQRQEDGQQQQQQQQQQDSQEAGAGAMAEARGSEERREGAEGPASSAAAAPPAEAGASQADGGGGGGDGGAAAAAATALALAGQLAASLGVSVAPTFEERRAGSMAARLLSDVQVPRPQSPG
ncbi:MAG: putative methyltransferase-domain-containing protein, partial [Monoraphidium minutum]